MHSQDVSGGAGPAVPKDTRGASAPILRALLPAAALALALLAVASRTLPGMNVSEGGAAPPAPVPAITVGTATAAIADWPMLIEASGPIEAWQEASVAAQVAGLRLVRLAADVGDRVREGQVLAEFDTAMLLAEQRRLAAEIAEAKALLAEAIENQGSAERLQRGGALSEKGLREARTGAAVRSAQLASAEARLAANRIQVQRATVLAPVGGTVSARTGRLGAVVGNAGEELFRLIAEDRLEWRGQLTASQAREAAAGQGVELALPDGSRATGRIRRLSPGFDAGTRLLTAYADILPGSPARPGMYATGRIRKGRRAATVVPAPSLVLRDGHSYVFKVAGGSPVAPVAMQRVVTGRQRDDLVEVLEGVAAGDMVVAAGAGFLDEGELVRIAPQPGQGPRP